MNPPMAGPIAIPKLLPIRRTAYASARRSDGIMSATMASEPIR